LADYIGLIGATNLIFPTPIQKGIRALTGFRTQPFSGFNEFLWEWPFAKGVIFRLMQLSRSEQMQRKISLPG